MGKLITDMQDTKAFRSLVSIAYWNCVCFFAFERLNKVNKSPLLQSKPSRLLEFTSISCLQSSSSCCSHAMQGGDEDLSRRFEP